MKEIIIKKTVFEFGELSEKAKEDDATMADLSNANDWYYYADGSLATDIFIK